MNSGFGLCKRVRVGNSAKKASLVLGKTTTADKENEKKTPSKSAYWCPEESCEYCKKNEIINL